MGFGAATWAVCEWVAESRTLRVAAYATPCTHGGGASDAAAQSSCSTPGANSTQRARHTARHARGTHPPTHRHRRAYLQVDGLDVGVVRRHAQHVCDDLAAVVLVHETRAGQPRHEAVTERVVELALVVVEAARRRVIDASDVDDDIEVLENGRVARAHDFGVFELAGAAEHPAAEGLVAVERAGVRADLDLHGRWGRASAWGVVKAGQAGPCVQRPRGVTCPTRGRRPRLPPWSVAVDGDWG